MYPARLQFVKYIRLKCSLYAPIPRLRISINIRITYPDKKWNKLNNVGAILIVRINKLKKHTQKTNTFIRMRMTC